MSKSILYFFCCGALLLLTGCATEQTFLDFNWEKLNDAANYQPRYSLSIHQIVEHPRAKKLEVELTSYDGRKIWINSNYFFNSKNITDIKLLERVGKPGFYDLELTLDTRGRIHWLQMAAQFRDTKLALLIDGVYFGSFAPQQLADEDATTVKLDGPFDQVMASGIRKYARKNYEHYNPNSTNFWGN